MRKACRAARISYTRGSMLELLAWLIAAPFAFALSYLALELAAGLAPLRFSPGEGAAAAFAIVIPAHNEAAGIAATVASLRATSPAARILVVADNCSDDTAALARAAGAEVVERHDCERHGKGFALAFGRDHLSLAPPEAVLVLDADCRIAAEGAGRLTARAIVSGAPVQAANLLVAPANSSPLVGLSNFAMLIKNLVRARGLMRIGGGALLFGTGMAFPWILFRRIPLATSNMVEDLDLGLELARNGIKVILDDAVLVTSPAAGLNAGRGQRSRWEHGFLETASRQAGPLLAAAIRRRSRHLAALGAHLLIPPLALLIGLVVPAIAAVGLLILPTGSYSPLIVLLAPLTLVMLLLFVAWGREAREMLTLADLIRAPLYIVWKIPIYLAFFRRRQTEWNRTERDSH